MDQTVRLVFFNERGLRAGWRLAIFVAMILAIVLPLGLIMNHAGQSGPAPQLPSNYSAPVFSALGELVPFLVLLLLCWIMSKIEHRTVGAYGLALRRPAWPRFWTGYFFWGFVPLSILLLVMRALNVFYFGQLTLHGVPILIWGVLWGCTFLTVGLLEEFLFRGYALVTLAEGLGFWPAAIILGILFARAHMGNTGETRVGIVATGFFALFAAAILRRTGDLWLAVGAHSGWDWSQSFFYGVPDSGVHTPGHLLNPQLSSTAPVWLSGGTVGPEGSVLTLILWGLMFAGFLWLYRKRPAPALIIEAGNSPPPQLL